MKLIGISYRKWAIEIYKKISKKNKIKIFETNKIPLKQIKKLILTTFYFTVGAGKFQIALLKNIIVLCCTHLNCQILPEGVLYKIKS